MKGDPDGAIAEIREATRLNPEEQAYRTQLSALLKSQEGFVAAAVIPTSIGIKTDDDIKYVAVWSSNT